MNKKIIHLIQALDNGGCENMLLRTLPLLVNFEHIIITLNKEGELAPKFKEKNIKIINLKQKNLIDLYSYQKLLKLINEVNPDIIISYLFHADVIGRLFIQKISNFKVIPFLRTTYNHKKYWLPRLFEKLTHKQVPHYLANSESVKDFLVGKGVKMEKITVIPNGIDTNFYDKIPKDEKLKNNLNIDTKDIVIICVANLHINKGHKYLLEAFEEIFRNSRKIRPAPHLILVGDGQEKEKLLKQMKNYSSKNNIIFLGKRNDVPSLLKISDIFVFPTLFEGMSNALMEAMAIGLPVSATDIPENRELLDGVNNLLFKPKDSKKIVEEISRLLSDSELRDKIGKRAKKKISNKFEMETIIEKFSNFLDKLISDQK